MVALYRLKDYIAENEPYIKYEGGRPIPDRFLKVWQGDSETDDLSNIFARLGITPPPELHGYGVTDTDILEVSGKCYVLDPSGFHEVEFDTTAVKVMLHARYGDGIVLDEAAVLSTELAKCAYEMDIPIGYKSISGVFRPSLHHDNPTYYLHPDYVKGDEAKRLVSRLSDLMEYREDTLDELLDCRPVYPDDIDRVWQKHMAHREELDARMMNELKVMADYLGCMTQEDCAAVAALLYENGISVEELESCIIKDIDQSM